VRGSTVALTALPFTVSETAGMATSSLRIEKKTGKWQLT
jgi:hypothetical protein